MIMPKKTHSKGNPRKFSDKIALIKHKEAISNANFHSALHGLTAITMNRKLVNDSDYIEVKDNCSSNSYSPESFTSESNTIQHKSLHLSTNKYGDVKKMDSIIADIDDKTFKSCHELSNMDDVNTTQTYHEKIKFRHVGDRPHLKMKELRHSNIEGYYPHNKNLPNLRELVYSDSLPNVSILSSTKDFPVKLLEECKNSRNSVNREHIDLQETLSNLEQVKLGKNSKMAILEHLKSRGVHTSSNIHHHHIQSRKDPTTLGLSDISSSSSLHKADEHGHNHTDYICACNQNEKGHLKHYSAANSPYISPNYRDKHNCKEVESSYRSRHLSGNPYSAMNYMKLNINCCNNIEECSRKTKSLTPQGIQSNSWFNNTKSDINSGLLQPPSPFDGIVKDNWRRVASESSIQNKIIQQNNTNITNDSSFERVNSLKRESTANQYKRNQPITSYPIEYSQNFHNSLSNSSDVQRKISQMSVSSSFLDNLMGLKSPDENIDPSLMSDKNMFKSPDYVQGRIFVFDELKEPTKNNIILNVGSPLFIKNDEYVKLENSYNYVDSYLKRIETIDSINCDNNICDENVHIPPDSNNDADVHECYWGQSNDEKLAYTKEPSPKIKPCESLDPNNVPVDLFTDFSNITENSLEDEEMQRRHSLNWTDEVLKNLNNESVNNDCDSTRERGMSICQSLMPLTEEEVVNSFVDISEN